MVWNVEERERGEWWGAKSGGGGVGNDKEDVMTVTYSG